MNYTSILLATLTILSTTTLSLKINHDQKLIKIPRSAENKYSLEHVNKILALLSEDVSIDNLYFNDMTRGDVKALELELIAALPMERLQFLLAKLMKFDVPLKSASVVKANTEAVKNRLAELDPTTAYNLLRSTLPPGPSKILEEGEDVAQALGGLKEEVEDVANVVLSGEGNLMEELGDVQEQVEIVVEEMGELVNATTEVAKKRFHRNPLNYFRSKNSKSVTISEEEDEVVMDVKGDGDNEEEVSVPVVEKKKKGRFNIRSMFGGRSKEKGGFAPEWISNYRGDPQEHLSSIVESFTLLSAMAANDPSTMSAYRPMLVTIAQLISKAATAEGSLLELDEEEMGEIEKLQRSLNNIGESSNISSGFVGGNGGGGLTSSGFQADPTRNKYVPSTSRKLRKTKRKL